MKRIMTRDVIKHDQRIMNAFSNGELFTLGGSLVTDKAVAEKLTFKDCVIRPATTTEKQSRTTDAQPAPYDRLKHSIANAWKGE